MAAPAQPRMQAKAPELGSFPLDHFRECKAEVETYYRCLEEKEHCAPLCRDSAKAYLKCRMDRGLMSKADVKQFGLPDTDFIPTKLHKQDMRRDLVRGSGSGSLIGAIYERDFKAKELKREDGYEAVKGTTEPAKVAYVRPSIASSRSVEFTTAPESAGKES